MDDPYDDLGRRLRERVRRGVLRRALLSSPKYETLILDGLAARLRVRFGLTDMTDGQVRAALEKALRKAQDELVREAEGEVDAAPNEGNAGCEIIDILTGTRRSQAVEEP